MVQTSAKDSAGTDQDLLIKTSVKTTEIVLNRRENRAVSLEKWGRIRLTFISMVLFFFIYICFAVGSWSEQRPQIIVDIPPNDNSLPGPKGRHTKYICITFIYFLYTG